MRKLDDLSQYVLQTSRVVETLERKIIELQSDNARLRKKVAIAQYTFPFMLGAIVGACLIIVFW